jgi:hypothetical protein
MIRIRRAPEAEACPELPAVRAAELIRVRDAMRKGQELDQELLRREYGVAREALAKAQHLKCCYCESRLQDERFEHIEHFRPIRDAWGRHTKPFRVARQRFVALALDVLDHHFPAHVRRRWGLDLTVLYR